MLLRIRESIVIDVIINLCIVYAVRSAISATAGLFVERSIIVNRFAEQNCRKPTKLYFPNFHQLLQHFFAVFIYHNSKGKGNCIAVMEHHVTATECHLPYGITQCYLLPYTSELTPHPASQAGNRFTYPGGIEGWVDLGDLLHSEMVYPPADGRPSKY